MDCFLVLFPSDFRQEVITKLGEQALVFTLDNSQTSNLLKCFNAQINPSPNFNFQKLNVSVPHSIAEDRVHSHRGEASVRVPMCKGALAGEAHPLDSAKQLVHAVVSEGSMAHNMPVPTSASGAGTRRPSANQPKSQEIESCPNMDQTSERKREDRSEQQIQPSHRPSSSSVGAAREEGDVLHPP